MEEDLRREKAVTGDEYNNRGEKLRKKMLRKFRKNVFEDIFLFYSKGFEGLTLKINKETQSLMDIMHIY